MASRTLSSLAELVDRVGAGRDVEEHAAELRFQAERLQRADASAFVPAGWIRRALLAALAGLDRAESGHQEELDRWIETARRVVHAMPDKGSISFQRAPLQDAFRATLDAFGMALFAGAACGSAPRALSSREEDDGVADAHRLRPRARGGEARVLVP